MISFIEFDLLLRKHNHQTTSNPSVLVRRASREKYARGKTVVRKKAGTYP